MVASRETNFISSSLATQSVSYEEKKAILRGSKRSAVDTLASAKKGTKTLEGPAGRIPLPPSKGEGNKAYLKLLAEAFAHAYSAEEKGVEFQTSDLVKLQQLDQTMSSAVLDSTHIAIGKEQKALVKEQKIDAEQKAAQEEAAKVSGIMTILGIALIVVTVLSSVLDAGASLALVPEEAGLEAGAEAGGEAAGDAASESADSAAQGGTEGAEMGGMASSDASSGVDTAVDEGSTSIDNAEQVSEDTTNTSKTSLKENMKSALKAWKDFRAKPMLGRKATWALRGATGAAFATPQIMNAHTEFKVAGYQAALSETQTDIGKQVAKCKLQGADLQWYQQLVQRSSGVTTNLVEQMGNTIEVAGNTMNAYRQVAAGMSQAKRG